MIATFAKCKTFANMNSNIVCGPKNVSLPSKSIASLSYENLQRENGQKILLVDSETNQCYNAKEIQEKCVKLAVALKKAGVKQQDVITIVSENSINVAFAIVAIHYIGATVNPLNPALTARELRYAFGLFKPKLVMCTRKLLDRILEITNEVPFVEMIISMDDPSEEVSNVDALIENEALCDIGAFVPDEVESPDQVAILLLTSGTTSLPKGVQITYASVAYHVAYLPLLEYFKLSPDAVMLLNLPLCHVYGILTFATAIYNSIKAIVMSKFVALSFLKTIENHKVTALYLVPPIMSFLSTSPLVDNFDLSSLRLIGCGGAPLSIQLINAVIKRFNVPVRVGYGMTESGVTNICVNPKKEGCVGHLLPHIEAKIIEPTTNTSLGPNKIGEICLKGPSIMKGYYDGPCDAVDEEGFLHTGDVGYHDDNGFLYVTDRIKDIIKYKGYQVSPMELESILAKHPAVMEAAVIGLPDKRAGELPLAVIVKRQDKDVTEKELTDFVAGQVTDYKFLRGGVRFIAAIPKNANGKVLKRVVREWALA